MTYVTAQAVRDRLIALLSADATVTANFPNTIKSSDPAGISQQAGVDLAVVISAESNQSTTLGDLEGDSDMKSTQLVLIAYVWREQNNPMQMEAMYAVTAVLIRALLRCQVDPSTGALWNIMSGNSVTEAGSGVARPVATVYQSGESFYSSKTLVTLTGRV